MSAKRLPPWAITLPVIAEGQTVPHEVSDMAEAILAAEAAGAQGGNARAILNAGIGRDGAPRAARMRVVADWLTAQTTKKLFASETPGNSYSEWVRAVDALAAGGPAHKAFGMNKPGRPSSYKFTAIEDLAAAAEHAKQSGRSATSALDAFAIRPDRREVDRIRTQIKGVTGLNDWAAAAARRWPLKK